MAQIDFTQDIPLESKEVMFNSKKKVPGVDIIDAKSGGTQKIDQQPLVLSNKDDAKDVASILCQLCGTKSVSLEDHKFSIGHLQYEKLALLGVPSLSSILSNTKKVLEKINSVKDPILGTEAIKSQAFGNTAETFTVKYGCNICETVDDDMMLLDDLVQHIRSPQHKAKTLRKNFQSDAATVQERVELDDTKSFQEQANCYIIENITKFFNSELSLLEIQYAKPDPDVLVANKEYKEKREQENKDEERSLLSDVLQKLENKPLGWGYITESRYLNDVSVYSCSLCNFNEIAYGDKRNEGLEKAAITAKNHLTNRPHKLQFLKAHATKSHEKLMTLLNCADPKLAPNKDFFVSKLVNMMCLEFSKKPRSSETDATPQPAPVAAIIIKVVKHNKNYLSPVNQKRTNAFTDSQEPPNKRSRGGRKVQEQKNMNNRGSFSRNQPYMPNSNRGRSSWVRGASAGGRGLARGASAGGRGSARGASRGGSFASHVIRDRPSRITRRGVGNTFSTRGRGADTNSSTRGSRFQQNQRDRDRVQPRMQQNNSSGSYGYGSGGMSLLGPGNYFNNDGFDENNGPASIFSKPTERFFDNFSSPSSYDPYDPRSFSKDPYVPNRFHTPSLEKEDRPHSIGRNRGPQQLMSDYDYNGGYGYF